MNELTPAERRRLKARAHPLRPVVMVGDAGLTPQVLREIDVNLKSHELIKIRVLGDDRASRAGLMERICDATAANPVQTIGKILVIYRRKPPEEQPEPKQAARPNPASKSKRERNNKR